MQYNHLKSINVEKALEMMGGFEQIFEKVVQSFIENNQTLIKDVNDALLTDRSTARRLVHSVKGISQNIGALGLYEYAKDLEQAILDDHNEQIDHLLPLFTHEFNNVMKELKSIQF